MVESGMRDLRRYAKQTNARLAAGFILLLFLVGDGLVFYFFGSRAAVSGLICIFAGLSPVVLIWLVLKIVEWIARQADN
jgi:hypothetical protein